jgi:hypothetical protein
MPDIIGRLMTAKSFTTKELQDAYVEWGLCTAEVKLEFAKQRECLVKNCAGLFYDDSRRMKTSGSSNGVVNEYRWGPCMHEFFLFHYRLCFGHINHDGLAYLNLNGSEWRLKSIVYGDTKLLIISGAHGVSDDKVLETIHNEFRSPIIWMMPTQLEIMIKRESTMLDKLIDKYQCFHCTGEICSSFVKEYMKSKNVLLLDTMRIWNGGATFYTCCYGGLHWNDMASIVQIKDGHLFTSDLWNLAQPFWDVDTGDNLEIHDDGECLCGLRRQRNEWKERVYTYKTPKGYVSYDQLRNVFYKSVSPEVIHKNIIIMNFGIGEKYLHVFCEFKHPVKLQLSDCLSEETGLKVKLHEGLQYGVFKNKRMFYIKDEIMFL